MPEEKDNFLVLRLCMALLQISEIEKASVEKDKNQLEADLNEREAKLKEAIHKLQLTQTEAEKDFEFKYHTLTAEGKQLAVELATAHKLLEGRDRELDLLQDKLE